MASNIIQIQVIAGLLSVIACALFMDSLVILTGLAVESHAVGRVWTACPNAGHGGLEPV